MPVRIDVTPESGLLIVHDAALSLPAVDRDKMEALERDAGAGKLFFLAAEIHPVRADLYIGEASPPELQQDFQPLGGSFLPTCHRVACSWPDMARRPTTLR